MTDPYAPTPAPSWRGPTYSGQLAGGGWPQPDYATWGSRVGAFLIDQLPALLAQLVFGVGYGVFLVDLFHRSSAGLAPTFATTPLVLMGIGAVLALAALGWQIYNRWIVGGRTGQSLGKRLTGIKLVAEQTGRPVGAMNAFARDMVHILDGAAYVGYLWPLWDAKKQTFADMLVHTVVLRAPRS